MKPVCLVTGAAGRLGRALCLSLAGEYRVIAAYRRNQPDVPSQLARPLDMSAGGAPAFDIDDIYCVQADLSRREDVRRLVEVGMARYGRIDAVVNSAADLRYHGRLSEIWQAGEYPSELLSLNAVAPFLLVSAVFDSCWKNDAGENARFNSNVVNISSTSGIQVFKSNEPFYAASKAAMNMLTLHLAVELAPYSVRANVLCPGRFDNEASTAHVVSGVRKLLDGSDSGTLLHDW